MMPQTKDTGLLYAFQLVVLHEVLQALGYRGLALIIDEAKHVRTYSANRFIRANNFCDILARCAHARGGSGCHRTHGRLGDKLLHDDTGTMQCSSCRGGTPHPSPQPRLRHPTVRPGLSARA